MRFEINSIMEIGVAFKRKSVLLSKKKTGTVTNARTWFKGPRKPLADVFPHNFFSEN